MSTLNGCRNWCFKDRKGLAQGHTRQYQTGRSGLHTHSLSHALGFVSLPLWHATRSRRPWNLGPRFGPPVSYKEVAPVGESWSMGEKGRKPQKGKKDWAVTPVVLLPPLILKLGRNTGHSSLFFPGHPFISLTPTGFTHTSSLHSPL